MAHADDISRMTDEVMRDIQEKGAGFNRAVSWALHRRGIYHECERDRYNYFFRAIQKRYRRRDRQGLKASMQGPRPWQHGKIVRDHPPAKGKFYKSDPWGADDPDNFFFPDNSGFVHENLPSLPEAPC